MHLKTNDYAIVQFYVAMQWNWPTPSTADSNDGHFFLIIRPEKCSLFHNSLVLKHRRVLKLRTIIGTIPFASDAFSREAKNIRLLNNTWLSDRKMLFETLRLM